MNDKPIFGRDSENTKSKYYYSLAVVSLIVNSVNMI